MTKLGPDHRADYRDVNVVEGYDRWAATYDRAPNPLIALEEAVTLELIGDVQGRRVLDLGCGTGRYGVLLTERGASVVGVDPSAGMLAQAKGKITPRCHFELLQGTIESIGLPGEHFDLVVSALTLSHLPDLETTLTEAVRVLKRGGLLVVSDFHPYWPIAGHNYAEFRDETGQEYHIPEYPHLMEEYWRLSHKLGLCLEAIREPRVDGELIARFPSLAGYEGVPLAIVLKARKLP